MVGSTPIFSRGTLIYVFSAPLHIFIDYAHPQSEVRENYVEFLISLLDAFTSFLYCTWYVC
jgi:hypothetical protein